MKVVRNPKTGARHILSEDENITTYCGQSAKEYKAVNEKATCRICIHLCDDPDVDPLGLLDDDMPDGAYWAMQNELYGNGFGF